MEIEYNDHYFDTILSKRIGMGVSQHTTFFYLGMMNFADGAEFIITALLSPILQNQ